MAISAPMARAASIRRRRYQAVEFLRVSQLQPIRICHFLSAIPLSISTPIGKGQAESRQSYAGLALPPNAVDDGPYVLGEGGSVANGLNVLDNDTDPRGDPMTAVLVTPPAFAGVFELRPDGTFDYEHDGGETSADIFTYTANDIDGVSNEATVSFSVTPVNDVPVITLNGSSSANISFGAPYVEEGATALDPEDGDISADIVVGGDFVNTAAPGTYVLTYNVLDGDGAAADEVTRTLHVPAPTVPPPVVQPSGGGGGMLGLVEVGAFCLTMLFRRRIMTPASGS